MTKAKRVTVTEEWRRNGDVALIESTDGVVSIDRDLLADLLAQLGWVRRL